MGASSFLVLNVLALACLPFVFKKEETKKNWRGLLLKLFFLFLRTPCTQPFRLCIIKLQDIYEHLHPRDNANMILTDMKEYSFAKVLDVIEYK